jgi:NADP-dependent alcohol dehydrogenase
MNVMRAEKGRKIAQYGERVWGIKDGSLDERIDKTIAATEEFFRSLGLAVRLSELSIGEDVVEEIVGRFKERGTLLGENSNIDYKLVDQILRQRL